MTSLHTVSPDVPFASAPPDPEVALSSRATSAGFRPVPSKPFSTSAARSCATVILLAVMAQTRVFETGHTHNHTRVRTQTVRPSNASVVVCTCPGVDSNKRQIHFPESRRLQRRPERKLLTIFRKLRTRGAEARHQGMNVQVSIRRRDMLTTFRRYMLFLRGAQGIFRVHYQQYLANVQQAQKLRSNVAAWGAHYRARARDRNMVRRKDPSSNATFEASEQVEGDVSYCLVRARRFPLPRVGFWRASSGPISARMQKQARAREIAPAARCSGGARRTYRVWLGASHREDLDSGRGRGAHAPQTPPKSPRIAPIRTPLPLCTTKNSVNSASPRNGVA